MKIAYNKVIVDKNTEKNIKLMFFRQIEMRGIVEKFGITERIIRRIINENNWIEKRERYLRFLCSYAASKNIQLYKIAEITNIKYTVLARIHRKYKTKKYKIKIWNKRITDEIENIFVREYLNGKSSQKIAEAYGFKTDKTVLDVLKKKNIKRRGTSKLTFYEKKFFEKINTHEKAYILGLIMTDGYIINDYSGFGIQLTENDGYLLEKISDIIVAKQGVIKIKCDSKRRKMPNAKDMVRLTVHNRKIAEDLKKLGVVRNKTRILRYNDCVPKRYLPSFFRGLIDGDGSIGIDSRGYYWISIASASKSFLQDIQNNNFKWNINTSKCKNGNLIHVLKVQGGQKEIFRFYKWIYKNKNDLYLRRKYAKVQDKIS